LNSSEEVLVEDFYSQIFNTKYDIAAGDD